MRLFRVMKMLEPRRSPIQIPLTRRDFLRRSGMGFASLGLAGLMASEGLLAAPAGADSPLTPRTPHVPGKAKRVLHLFANGGAPPPATAHPQPRPDSPV